VADVSTRMAAGRVAPAGIRPVPGDGVYAGIGRAGNALGTSGYYLDAQGYWNWDDIILGNKPDTHYALPANSRHFDKFDPPAPEART